VITHETRREAFENVELALMEAKVYEELRKGGPMSAEQIMDKLGTSNPNNVRPRLTGLSRKGVIQVVGKRKNRGGRNEAVWEVIA
jgi:predicted ArsR family transcriptional regulator